MDKVNTSILFVDDDKLTRTSYSIILSRITDELFIGKNGKEGIQLYHENHPDIIISDIQMPDMNGLDMIRKIKEVSSDVKTIITTAYNEVNYFIEAIDVGVNGYLLKPIDNNKLFALIKELAAPVKSFDKKKDDILKKKRAEETIRESEQLYKALLKQSHDLIFIYSENKILFVNERVSEITGFTDHEIYKGEVWDLVHPDDRKRLQSIRDKQLSGSNLPIKIETSLITKNGELKYADVAFSQIEYRGKKAIMGIARDISDRKKAEEALIKSQERLKFALDATNDGLWDWNYGSSIVYFNPRYSTMLGYEPNELKGNYDTWEKLLHPDDKEYALKALSDYINHKRKDYEVEFRLKTKDGNWKWILGRGKIVEIDEKGNPVRLIGTHVDLSERKVAEQKIQESEKKYRALFESAGDAIFIHDLKGKFIEVNQIACERLGYTREELLEMTPKDIDIAKAKKLKEEAKEILRNKKERFYETIHKSKDGKSIHVEINSKLIDYKGDKAILSIARDITQRIESRQILIKSLKEKEILLKEVHHRVKNNMQLISSILNLQTKTVKNPIIRGYLEESQERIRSMALIHENLYKTKNLANINFRDYVKTLTDNLLRSFGSDRNKIMIHLDIDEIYLSLDTGIPCGLIINELVSNAIKYAFIGKKNGRIEIKINRVSPRRIKLAVKDDGVGIGKVDIKNAETLGLQLVATLAEQINGKLQISSNNGTEINIIFND